jgi:hypothetical protein
MYSCASRTAAAPSPTAEATRLIERYRASPAANTPGMDVSNGSGARFSGPRDTSDSSRTTSRPVRM